MRLKLVLSAFLLASLAYAKEPQRYQSGQLLQMDSVSCGALRADSGHKQAPEALCQEYVLQTDTVVYRIRPRDEKHPVLLPVGNKAQFRLEQDRMLLRVEDFDGKERGFSVVSMTPRSDPKVESTTYKVNHLQ